MDQNIYLLLFLLVVWFHHLLFVFPLDILLCNTLLYCTSLSHILLLFQVLLSIFILWTLQLVFFYFHFGRCHTLLYRLLTFCFLSYLYPLFVKFSTWCWFSFTCLFKIDEIELLELQVRFGLPYLEVQNCWLSFNFLLWL